MAEKGKTVIEKIVSAHCEDDAVAGQIVWVKLDVVSARDFGGANVVKNFEAYYSGESVGDPTRTIFTFDCNVPANTIGYADNQHRCRLFARSRGIKVYDVDAGIGNHVMIEEGRAMPGDIVIGTDSHLNLLGAIGCFGQGMGDIDVAYGFKHTRTWFEVPQSAKITLTGDVPENTSAKDLALFLVGKLGASGLLGISAEISGAAIDAMALSERITLASMATEMGAISIFLQPTESLLNELEQLSGKSFDKSKLALLEPDKNAAYAVEFEFDISRLSPMIACPPKPDNVKPVGEVAFEKIPVDSVLVGSCTGGRTEDFFEFASVIEKYGLAEGVMAKIAPATRRVYNEIIKNGTIAALANAGVIIINQGCAGCAAGQVGMTGEGEIQVTTGNRNFTGKQGKGNTYLASARTAGFSAARGYICAE
ncbi:homoaconitate hydratase family protein [bacterium]|nr:homoaconitate hydratase family protein [bacterium]